jgi:hypothetical protein
MLLTKVFHFSLLVLATFRGLTLLLQLILTRTNNKCVHPGNHTCETVTNQKAHVDYVTIHVLSFEAFVATELNKIFLGRQPHQGVKVPEMLENFHTLMQLSAQEDFIENMFYSKKFTTINKNRNKSTKQ